MGQDQALARLQQALASQRLSHAYIFHGPPGVGKELCARELAKTILCEKPKKLHRHGQDSVDSCDCCDSCPSCLAVEADIHPDFHLVYREQIHEIRGQLNDDGSAKTKTHQATELSIDVIREKLNIPAQRTSVYGRGKVFVVREIHLANVFAQNALLKTLEEPPDSTELILLADQLEGLLPTVLSRSQMINFVPLPRDFILQKLEQSGCQSPERDFWSRFANGSLGRALWLARQDWYQAKLSLVQRLAKLNPHDVVALAELLIELTKAYSDEVRKQDRTISQTVANQRMYSFLLSVISSFYRDIMLTHAGSSPTERINCDQESAINHLARSVSLLDAGRALSLIAAAEHLIRKNVNANLVLDDLFGDLSSINGN